MAYRKRSKKILAGSLSLVPPADLTPEPDSPQLRNWRTDQAGALRSRRGLERQATLSGIHSLFRSGQNRYAGAGTSLYQGTALTTNVSGGFSGEPLGFAAYQGFTWVMDPTKRLKVEGANPDNWLPATPASAPVAAAGSDNAVTLVEFDDTETWTAVRFEENAEVTANSDFDSSNKLSGTHSFHVECNPTGRYQIRHVPGSPINTAIAGAARADDKLRLNFYSSDPPGISTIKITLFNGLGAARTSVTATVSGSAVLNPANFSWSLIEISRQLDGSATLTGNQEYQDLSRRMLEAQAAGHQLEFDNLNQARLNLYEAILASTPSFRQLGIPVGGTTTFNWTAITEIWIEVEALPDHPLDIHFDLFECVGGDAGSLEGEFQFYVTYDTDAAHESNPSAASNRVKVRKSDISLSSIPVSPDSQVTMRRIYMVGGAIQTPLRVLTIANNSATSATIEGPVSTVQDLNIAMPTDHDPPPPARVLLGPVGGRLLAANSDAYPQRLWWTPVAQPWFFPGSDDTFEGNWEDVGEEGEPVIAMTHHKRITVVYKQRSIWRYSGDPALADPEETSAKIGLVGRKAVVAAGQYDYFASWEGIYKFNGDYEERISQQIDPIFKNDYVAVAPGIHVPPIAADYRATAVMGYRDGRLYFSYPEEGQTAPNVTLVYDEETKRWAHHSTGFNALYFEGTTNGLMGASGNGLFEVGTGLTDDGTAIPLVWHSRYDDQALPDIPKRYADLVVEYQTGAGEETPSTLTVKAYFDNGTEVSLGTINSIDRVKKTFKLGTDGDGYKAFNCAIRIEGNASSTCIIYGVFLHWYPEARQALTFDSGLVDLGTELVKEISKLEFDLEAAGTVNWALDTDLPGQSVAQRETGTIAATTGREVSIVLLTAKRYGRKLRFTMWSTSLFQLHGLRVRVRPIGVYLDGANGDEWESEPLSLAP